MKLPEEFISANSVPVERATITRDRMEEILRNATFDLQRQLAALTEDYKDLEAQLLAVGAGGVSKLIGDKE